MVTRFPNPQTYGEDEMRIKSGYDDDIQFSGFGSASTITEYAKPKKSKPSKTRVGFAIPKKPKSQEKMR